MRKLPSVIHEIGNDILSPPGSFRGIVTDEKIKLRNPSPTYEDIFKSWNKN